MSIFSTIKHVGVIPALYKLKHLYLKPSPFIVSQSSQNGAYEYLQRYRFAANLRREVGIYPPIKNSNYIWVCWFQGLENAPLLVQRCVTSIQEYNPCKEVIILTEENISKYVTIPDYIQHKYQQGMMTRTHYSDIVRLFLLNQYGGIWMDSTILMTGIMPEYIENSSFFVFHSAIDHGHVCCATGFMASCANHPIVEDTLNMLLEYWKKENKLVSYSVIHLLLYLSINDTSIANRSYWDRVPIYYYTECEKLRISLNKSFNSTMWDQIQQSSPIHKLTYKFDEYHIDPTKKGTFYDVLINQNVLTC